MIRIKVERDSSRSPYQWYDAVAHISTPGRPGIQLDGTGSSPDEALGCVIRELWLAECFVNPVQLVIQLPEE